MARKKVLLQEWMTDEGYKTSISLSEAHLNETIAELKAGDRGRPEGRAMEVEVDEDADGASAGLVEMVEGGTIFLCEDEMEAIIYPE